MYSPIYLLVPCMLLVSKLLVGRLPTVLDFWFVKLFKIKFYAILHGVIDSL